MPQQAASYGVEDILFSQGLINQAQLSSLKLESINTGHSTEQLISQHNLVTPDKVVAARAQMMGVPFVSLEGKGVDTQIINLVPEAAARRYRLIPFSRQDNTLLVAMADPLDLQVVQFIEKKSGLMIKPFMALPEDIERAIGEFYSQNLTSEVTSALKEVSDLVKPDEKLTDQPEVIHEAPVSNIISQLLDFSIKSRASDIHIEPLEEKTRVRYRIDGILYEKIVLPKGVHDALISRIKILSDLKIEEKRLPQDGRFTYASPNGTFDLRVSTIPTVWGEKVVMRLLPKASTAPTLADLGFRPIALKTLEAQMTRPHGIILVCGPTGSGKTTTLYAVLTKLSTSRVNLSTIEDPVEYQIPGANQVQANSQIGLTFATALRAFLRQDPNIILVGEIRDSETADLAIQAALTGHQVFSTLHTNTAAGSIPRMLDMGTEPFLLASTINAVIGQRILRKICKHCKAPVNVPPEIVENLKRVLGAYMPQTKTILYKGAGCAECGHSGYQGRMGIYEVLQTSPAVMQLILKRASIADIEAQSVKEGMITLKQDGYLKAIEGVTTLEEVLRVAED